MSNGSNELKQEDDTDGLDPKTNAIVEHLGTKIIRVKDLIRTEQKLRDGKISGCLLKYFQVVERENLGNITNTV